jgi:hypothetical protein
MTRSATFRRPQDFRPVGMGISPVVGTISECGSGFPCSGQAGSTAVQTRRCAAGNHFPGRTLNDPPHEMEMTWFK